MQCFSSYLHPCKLIVWFLLVFSIVPNNFKCRCTALALPLPSEEGYYQNRGYNSHHYNSDDFNGFPPQHRRALTSHYRIASNPNPSDEVVTSYQQIKQQKTSFTSYAYREPQATLQQNNADQYSYGPIQFNSRPSAIIPQQSSNDGWRPLLFERKGLSGFQPVSQFPPPQPSQEPTYPTRINSETPQFQNPPGSYSYTHIYNSNSPGLNPSSIQNVQSNYYRRSNIQIQQDYYEEKTSSSSTVFRPFTPSFPKNTQSSFSPNYYTPVISAATTLRPIVCSQKSSDFGCKYQSETKENKSEDHSPSQAVYLLPKESQQTQASVLYDKPVLPEWSTNPSTTSVEQDGILISKELLNQPLLSSDVSSIASLLSSTPPPFMQPPNSTTVDNNNDNLTSSSNAIANPHTSQNSASKHASADEGFPSFPLDIDIRLGQGGRKKKTRYLSHSRSRNHSSINTLLQNSSGRFPRYPEAKPKIDDNEDDFEQFGDLPPLPEDDSEEDNLESSDFIVSSTIRINTTSNTLATTASTLRNNESNADRDLDEYSDLPPVPESHYEDEEENENSKEDSNAKFPDIVAFSTTTKSATTFTNHSDIKITSENPSSHSDGKNNSHRQFDPNNTDELSDLPPLPIGFEEIEEEDEIASPNITPSSQTVTLAPSKSTTKKSMISGSHSTADLNDNYNDLPPVPFEESEESVVEPSITPKTAEVKKTILETLPYSTTETVVKSFIVVSEDSDLPPIPSFENYDGEIDLPSIPSIEGESAKESSPSADEREKDSSKMSTAKPPSSIINTSDMVSQGSQAMLASPIVPEDPEITAEQEILSDLPPPLGESIPKETNPITTTTSTTTAPVLIDTSDALSDIPPAPNVNEETKLNLPVSSPEDDNQSYESYLHPPAVALDSVQSVSEKLTNNNAAQFHTTRSTISPDESDFPPPPIPDTEKNGYDRVSGSSETRKPEPTESAGNSCVNLDSDLPPLPGPVQNDCPTTSTVATISKQGTLLITEKVRHRPILQTTTETQQPVYPSSESESDYQPEIQSPDISPPRQMWKPAQVTSRPYPQQNAPHKANEQIDPIQQLIAALTATAAQKTPSGTGVQQFYSIHIGEININFDNKDSRTPHKYTIFSSIANSPNSRRNEKPPSENPESFSITPRKVPNLNRQQSQQHIHQPSPQNRENAYYPQKENKPEYNHHSIPIETVPTASPPSPPRRKVSTAPVLTTEIPQQQRLVTTASSFNLPNPIVPEEEAYIDVPPSIAEASKPLLTPSELPPYVGDFGNAATNKSNSGMQDELDFSNEQDSDFPPSPVFEIDADAPIENENTATVTPVVTENTLKEYSMKHQSPLIGNSDTGGVLPSPIIPAEDEQESTNGGVSRFSVQHSSKTKGPSVLPQLIVPSDEDGESTSSTNGFNYRRRKSLQTRR